MTAVYAVDACRTPIGKIKGALAAVRPDHLSADVIAALLARNPWLDPAQIDDVYWGAVNQAGEDNRNAARMAVLLAGLPVEIPGATVNRLRGSGMEAMAVADELKLDPERLNVNGGAIAIGHPLGCSGARMTATLLHELRWRGASRAAATMCIGVGQGVATLWES